MTASRLGEARTRLLEERDRLEEVRRALAGRVSGFPGGPETTELPSTDQYPTDAGSDIFEREKDLSILEQIDAEMAGIEGALGRVEGGDYGTCAACGGPIGRERLQARPAALLCVKDQSRVERTDRSERAG